MKSPTSPFCPEGNYSAVLIDAFYVEDESNTGLLTEKLRFTFRVDVPWRPSESTRAWINFDQCPEKSYRFRRTMQRWLGEDFIRQYDESGVFEPEMLIGEKADLVIEHWHNSNYEIPYVSIKEILPVGSLELTVVENGTKRFPGMRRHSTPRFVDNHRLDFLD